MGTVCKTALSFTTLFCHIRAIGCHLVIILSYPSHRVANPRYPFWDISAPSGIYQFGKYEKPFTVLKGTPLIFLSFSSILLSNKLVSAKLFPFLKKIFVK
jgi:hypothetical protein